MEDEYDIEDEMCGEEELPEDEVEEEEANEGEGVMSEKDKEREREREKEQEKEDEKEGAPPAHLLLLLFYLRRATSATPERPSCRS